MSDESRISPAVSALHRALLLAAISGLPTTGSAAIDVICGGGLGKLLFKQQIENARSEWGELDQGIKSCVSKRTKLTSDELAERCIGPGHSRINQDMSLCRKAAEKAKEAHKAKERQLAAEKKAREQAHKEAQRKADAAKAHAEAHRLELIEKHGEETAKHILAKNVVKGMDGEQVHEAVGPPLRKESIPPNFELWIYRDKKIAFSDRKVTHVDRQ